MHDISGVFPKDSRVAAARQLGIEVLPEEETYPMIIHQKLSTAMARDLFDISDERILSAIECHTTLKGLNQSLVHASLAYIDYLWQRRDMLIVVHPWLKDAREDLLRVAGK